MFKRSKRIVAAILGAALALSMVGCGSKEEGLSKEGGYENSSTTKAMVIGDYDINMDELIMYSLQIAYLSGLTTDSLDESTVETNKNTALSLLRTNKIIYNVAIHNDCELGDSDMEYVDKSIDQFKERFPQDFLDKYGIADDIIEKVFTEQAIVSKFENDIKNDIGTTVQEGLEEEFSDYSFHTIYYMLFPTVEVDNENPATDEDGNYIYVSDSEKEEILKKAEEAANRIRAGEDYQQIADEYGVSAYSDERVGYVGAYSDDEINEQIATLKNGECLDPYEDTLGYAVVVMIKADDEDLKESYISSYTSSSVSTQFDDLEQKWLSTITVDEENDMEGTVWEDFDFKAMVKDMESVGIVSAAE